MTHTELAFAVIFAFASCGAIFWIGLVLFLTGAHEPKGRSGELPPFPEDVLRRLQADARQRAQTRTPSK